MYLLYTFFKKCKAKNNNVKRKCDVMCDALNLFCYINELKTHSLLFIATIHPLAHRIILHVTYFFKFFNSVTSARYLTEQISTRTLTDDP
jgi:hypothetical protein